MVQQKEKQTLYESLVELTKASDPEIYFSRYKILEHVKDKIEKEFGCNIHYRAVYKRNWYQDGLGRWNSNTERIDLDDVLPRKKNVSTALEELVKEGKAKKVSVVLQGWNLTEDFPRYNTDDFNGYFYRAMLPAEENAQ